MTSITALSDLYDTLERLARERPRDIALVAPRGQTTTFAALNATVGAAATRLQAAGMQRGDAVAFSVRPSVEAVILILATVRAGGIIVAADPGMGAELFAARMAAVQPRFVMAESLLYAISASSVARRVLRRRHLELPQVGKLAGCQFVRVGRWLPGTPWSIDAAQLMAPLPHHAAPVQLDPDDAVLVIFTSGTTAEPRAVVHTARSITAMLDASALIAHVDAGAVVMTDQLHSILPALMAGARVVLPRIGAGPAAVLDLLHRSAATHAFFVPSDLHRMVTQCEQGGRKFPATMRQIMLGAGPVDRALLARLGPFLPSAARVTSVYGLTEMVPVACVDMSEKLAWEGEGDLVGAPLPGAQVRIGAGGELCVGGEWLCARYLGQEPLQEVATGDLARFDAEGRIVLLGRVKDMIIRGHYNIYPALYEGKIAEIPGVARCALIGVWDAQRGDEWVVLVLEPTTSEKNHSQLKRRVALALQDGALIDTLALPDEIVVMPLPESGRTYKIDRKVLRKQLTQKEGSTPSEAGG
jgi:acyl-CoA synthetase (AMP-forming)/AMP-acid ligase II